MRKSQRAAGAPSIYSLSISEVARRRATRAQQTRLGGWHLAEGTPLAGRSRIVTGPAEPGAEVTE
jgi:hypothetical protein